jgi:hypothetical protein
MNEQAMADYFIKVAKPRLIELLKLKVRHIYETTPGTSNSKLVVDGREVTFKSVKSIQPYRDIERFAAEDKVVGFLINPGLVPIVKAISMDLRGRNMLVTRRLQGRDDDNVVSHFDDFGIRLMLSHGPSAGETQAVWECLYGVA